MAETEELAYSVVCACAMPWAIKKHKNIIYVDLSIVGGVKWLHWLTEVSAG